MRNKRTRIVPGLVMTATFAAVVPACGGTTTNGDGGSDAKADVLGMPDGFFGVAAVAYCCFDAMSVADAGFVVPDASDAQDDGG